jgi:DNA-directed RNA polymerase specialized sigma24 family protein
LTKNLYRDKFASLALDFEEFSDYILDTIYCLSSKEENLVMQRQQQSGSSSNDPALVEDAGQQMKTPTGATTPHLAQVSPEDDDPIEDWLEFYDFHYILERVKKSIRSYPAIRHMPEEIASEVYDKFWQKLLKGPINNPPAYIAMMIRNKCIDYMRRHVTEACHIVDSYSYTREGPDIMESDQVLADSEGLRDPAEEFEYSAALQDMYRQVSLAITELPPRQQQAVVWHILRRAPDPQELMELFDVLHIIVPVVRQGDKDEEHLLEASYTHARKALAKRLNVDLSQFHQRKRQKCSRASNRLGQRL